MVVYRILLFCETENVDVIEIPEFLPLFDKPSMTYTGNRTL
jgi:hypothetical protein